MQSPWIRVLLIRIVPLRYAVSTLSFWEFQFEVTFSDKFSPITQATKSWFAPKNRYRKICS